MNVGAINLLGILDAGRGGNKGYNFSSGPCRLLRRRVIRSLVFELLGYCWLFLIIRILFLLDRLDMFVSFSCHALDNKLRFQKVYWIQCGTCCFPAVDAVVDAIRSTLLDDSIFCRYSWFAFFPILCICIFAPHCTFSVSFPFLPCGLLCVLCSVCYPPFWLYRLSVIEGGMKSIVWYVRQ